MPKFSNSSQDNDEISRDSPEWYQIHLATERLRVPEIYFQPSIIGCDQAGISETLDFILKKYDEETSTNLASNVFVTGTKIISLSITLDQILHIRKKSSLLFISSKNKHVDVQNLREGHKVLKLLKTPILGL